MIVLLTECYATLIFSVLLKVVLTFEFLEEMFLSASVHIQL